MEIAVIVNGLEKFIFCVVGMFVGMFLGYGLCVGDERRKREEKLWMRLLYQHQLNDERNKGMKKSALTVLVLVGLCLASVPAFPAEFSETNTQEISDESFTCCVAKGIIKGGDPQRPVIIMKVRATCSEAYTAIHEALKTFKDSVPIPQKQAPATADKKKH